MLIWDIDGTLIRTGGTGRNSMEMAFREAYGIKDALKNYDMAGMLDMVIYEQIMDRFGIPGHRRDPNAFFGIYCTILENEIKKHGNIRALPGIKQILATLDQNERFCNSLGTGNIKNGARLKLGAVDLNGYFPTGGFSDGNVKERWLVIKKAVENAKQHYSTAFDPEMTYVIGDTPRDIECGKRAGLRTIAVATGYFSEEVLKAYGPDHHFADLSNVQQFLSIFNQA